MIGSMTAPGQGKARSGGATARPSRSSGTGRRSSLRERRRPGRPPRPGRLGADEGIAIVLTPRQTAGVVGEVIGANRGLSPLLAALSDIRVAVACADGAEELDRSAQTLLRRLLVLMAFPGDGTPRSIADVAETHGIARSTAQRHVKAWVELGLLRRDSVRQTYERVLM